MEPVAVCVGFLILIATCYQTYWTTWWKPWRRWKEKMEPVAVWHCFKPTYWPAIYDFQMEVPAPGAQRYQAGKKQPHCAGLTFQLQSIAIVAYQWKSPSNGSATQESTVAQSYVCWVDSASPEICRACLIPATCSLCSGTCLANQPAGTKLPRQESPQEGSSDRPGRSSKGDPSASAACRCPTNREPSFAWAHQRMARHYYIR